MYRSLLFMLTVVLLISGCAKKPLEPIRVFWPPLPEQPRFEWLGTYASQQDLPRDSKDVFLDEMLGTRHDFRFGKPSGIVGDSDRNLVYVSDGDRNHVFVFDFNSGTIGTLTRDPIATYPAGLAMDSLKNIYVCDAQGGVVLKVSPGGAVLQRFGRKTLKKPVHIALQEDLGKIYVTDSLLHKVFVFSMEGELLNSFGDNVLFGPQGVAVDGAGQVFVADQLHARIQVFDPEGEPLYTFGERGDKDWNFEAPRGLALDSDGNLWVTDVRKSAFFVFDKEGQLLLSFSAGKNPSYPLSLAFPTAVTVDQRDRVYFSDLIYLRFQVWQYLSQAYLAKNPITEADKQRQLQLIREQQTPSR